MNLKSLKDIIYAIAGRMPADEPYTPIPSPLIDTPAIAKETPRKRVPYIPTDESPWSVIIYSGGKWKYDTTWPTRRNARIYARNHHGCGIKTRVVRAIIPTR